MKLQRHGKPKADNKTIFLVASIENIPGFGETYSRNPYLP